MIRTRGLSRANGLQKTKCQPETTATQRWAEKWKKHQQQKQTKEEKQNKSKWRICGVQGNTAQVKYDASEDIQEGDGIRQAAECKSINKAVASCGLREQG